MAGFPIHARFRNRRQICVLLEIPKWLQPRPNAFKPFSQSLYIDLTVQPNEPATPIYLGFRSGRNALLEHLVALRSMGVNHVILNLKYGRRHAAEVLEEIGTEVLPALDAVEA